MCLRVTKARYSTVRVLPYSHLLTNDFFCLLGGFDLAILVDGSSSVGGAANFKIVMQFVKSIYHSFMTGHRVRFALVIFGGGSFKVKNYSLLTV